MKIEKVVLKDMEIEQVGGEYKQVFTNEQTIPCFITNYALKRGKDLGLTKDSLLQGILKLKALEGMKSAEELDANAFSEIDEIEMQKVIYIGCLGAVKGFDTDVDFDVFLEKYHYTFEETLMLYTKLVSNSMTKQSNGFAKGLSKSTNNSGKKKSGRHR